MERSSDNPTSPPFRVVVRLQRQRNPFEDSFGFGDENPGIQVFCQPGTNIYANLDTLSRWFQVANGLIDDFSHDAVFTYVSKEVSRKLVENTDIQEVTRVRETLNSMQETSAGRLARIQGSLSEIWTFQMNSDIDLAFMYEYGRPYQIVRTNDANVFMIKDADRRSYRIKEVVNRRRYKVCSFTYIFLMFLFLLEMSILIPKIILPRLNNTCTYFYDSVHVDTMTFNGTTIHDLLEKFSDYLYYFASTVAIIPMLTLLITLCFELVHYLITTKRFACSLIPQKWKHGPAYTEHNVNFYISPGMTVTKSVDWVPCVIPYPGLEHLMVEWRKRHAERFGEQSLQCFNQCSVGMVMFDERLWRWSFSEFEGALIRNSGMLQGLSLSLLKHIIRNSGGQDSDIIKSYAIKTVFFWFVHFSVDENWSKESICSNALKMYAFLAICIRNSYLPNYFDSSENILRNCEDNIALLQPGVMVQHLKTNATEYATKSPMPFGIEYALGILSQWQRSTKKLFAREAKHKNYIACWEYYDRRTNRVTSVVFLQSVFLLLGGSTLIWMIVGKPLDDYIINLDFIRIATLCVYLNFALVLCALVLLYAIYIWIW